MWPRENKCQLQEKKSQHSLPGADILSLRVFSCIVILSEAKNLEKKAVRTTSLDMEPVRRGVAGLTPLRTDDAIQSIY